MKASEVSLGDVIDDWEVTLILPITRQKGSMPRPMTERRSP